ncbi:FAD-dependent oxidoreductase [Blastomonas sp.]|uniref:oxidoreductase n=1 Tax=Blastomonas sp. TaxID=1909299 RepID=UPI00359314BC
MSSKFERLFSEIDLGPTRVRNRILSTGHQTYLAKDGVPKEDLIAYQEARAQGGVGLIVNEAARFHASSLSDANDLLIHDDDAIPHFASLAAAVHRRGTRIFGQLSHAGRVTRRVTGGLRGVVLAPSATPEHRNQVVPLSMSTDLVEAIIDAAGEGARRYAEAGYDGIELMASHGLLFAQFLNPQVNQHTDCYGGSLDNRMRALTEALALVRSKVGPGITVGLRISAEELELGGLESGEVQEICRILDENGVVDYINTTIGSMAGLSGSIHVVPPMEIEPAYVAPHAARLKQVVSVPVMVAGRINDPQVGERVLSAGQADMVAMTRALITDPDMPNKARSGRSDQIRACIGCDQSCIGRFHRGYSISCIQTPRTGRKLHLAPAKTASEARRVLVVGGGPAGMRAALTAAEDGHRVQLHEADALLGGQVKLAQLLPGRSEFGGMITNMLEEMKAHDIVLHLNSTVNRRLIEAEKPNLVILATGSTIAPPDFEGAENGHVISAEDVLSGKVRPGGSVLVADWRCDWTGIGVAMQLATAGHRVRLAVNGMTAGQNVPNYTRDYWIGKLHEAEIEVIPYTRLFGVDGTTVYLAHAVSSMPVICEDIDTVVTVDGRRANTKLQEDIEGLAIPILSIGDCATARTAEEAIYEGVVMTRHILTEGLLH